MPGNLYDEALETLKGTPPAGAGPGRRGAGGGAARV
jgi:hypothetical protein